MFFQSSNPQYEYLRKKWTGKHQDSTQKFFQKHGDKLRRASLGGLSGLMLLTSGPLTGALPNHQLVQGEGMLTDQDKNKKLAEALKQAVPDEVRPLNAEEETKVSEVLANNLGVKASAELQGIRLNRSYGLIGGEQHLYRYPGDNVNKHAENASDWAMYGGAGIAPGLGAWGYFAPSSAQFTQKEKDQEKWYIAVQTFLAPGFAENTAKYRDFFKYRKMILVNPKTGQAVVTDIADAGPSEYTGKHLGGSPEVMQALGLAQGPRKGAVLYFFVDDPNNDIPLGPITGKMGGLLAQR